MKENTDPSLSKNIDEKYSEKYIVYSILALV